MEQDADASAAVADRLIAALTNEVQVLAELRQALAHQRAHVASGDPASLEVASQFVARAIFSLDETRRYREDILLLANGGRALPPRPLAAMGDTTPDLEKARGQVRAEAEAAVRELAETQDLLRAALRAGDAYLQALFTSVTEATVAYPSPDATPVAAAQMPTGHLVNRRA